jgi:leader peptidase (prepilin peptidase)/N-methyltransferase
MIEGRPLTTDELWAWWVAAGFAFAIGGTIGSFLNVVAYRLPLGLSLVRPGSRCPQCGTPIRPLDNIPIFGWLKLGGRCRACDKKISPRYPLVEFATAMAFLIVAWFEPLTGGANLPLSIAWESPEQIWELYGYHVLLIAALMGATLLEFDGHALPWKMVVLIFAVGLIVPLWATWLHPQPADASLAARLHERVWMLGLVDSIGGALVGMCCGLLASPASELGPAGRRGALIGIITLGWTGAFLGWQAGVSCALGVAIMYSLSVVYRPLWSGFRRLPFAGCVLAVVVAWIPLWHTITVKDPRLGAAADGWTLAFCGLCILGLSSMAWLFGRRRVN